MTAASDLFDYIDRLRRAGGWQSSRTVAQEAERHTAKPMSHTTVNDVFRRKRVPTWPVMAGIAMGLGGTEDDARPLWLAAWNEAHPIPEPGDTAPVAAARMDELIEEVRAVRALLEKLVDRCP